MTYGRRISTLCISPSNEFMAIGTHGGRWAIHRLRDGAEVRAGDLANRIHASAFHRVQTWSRSGLPEVHCSPMCTARTAVTFGSRR
jgi:hypothetical protein